MPLRDAMMRSGDCLSAKQVHMTWMEDATTNEGKQCLQRDVTEVDVSRRGAGRTCLMFVLFLRRMMNTMVKTGNECQLSGYMLLLGNFATAFCCAQVLFQPNFPCVTQRVAWCVHKKLDTAQTELVFTRLVDTASLDSRLHQSSKRVFHKNHVVSLFHPVLSLPVLHAQLFVVLGSTQVAELVVTFH